MKKIASTFGLGSLAARSIVGYPSCTVAGASLVVITLYFLRYEPSLVARDVDARVAAAAGALDKGAAITAFYAFCREVDDVVDTVSEASVAAAKTGPASGDGKSAAKTKKPAAKKPAARKPAAKKPAARK